jgi:lactate racemase
VLTLAYGTATEAAQLPPSWRPIVLRTVPPPAERSESFLIGHALDHPIGAETLENLLRPDDRVTLVVPDKTRACRGELLFPAVLQRIEASGVAPERITVLIATGTHPAQSSAEIRALLGDDILARYRVVEHDSRDPRACVPVGRTERGTPVSLNRVLLESTRAVAVGTIVHHYFAGFGGGPKMFVPGCAAYETAVSNHRRTLLPDGSFHPRCADGVTAGNPVIEDIHDALRFAPPSWYAATILSEDGRVCAAVAGDIRAAHDAGTRIVDDLYRIPFTAPSDVTIVSAGGHPKDINFIQAHKALHHAQYATRPGGVIVCLAACVDGLGNASFTDWFAAMTESEFTAALSARYSMNAHTAVALKEKTRRYTIIFVSALPRDLVARLGMTPASTLAEAVRLAYAFLPDARSVHVIPNGSLTVPHPALRA